MATKPPGEELMSRNRPAIFRQADLTRALRAAKAAGLEVRSITVDKNGRLELQLVTTTSDKEASAAPLDEWLAVHVHPT
jgi:hypothetical protein